MELCKQGIFGCVEWESEVENLIGHPNRPSPPMVGTELMDAVLLSDQMEFQAAKNNRW